jgi:hypothetical protein
MRRLRWAGGKREVPTHPYRDSAVIYGFFAVVLVVLTAATGGPLLPGDDQGKHGLLGLLSELGALTVAAIMFVLATGFSWWRWRVRLRTQDESR